MNNMYGYLYKLKLLILQKLLVLREKRMSVQCHIVYDLDLEHSAGIASHLLKKLFENFNMIWGRQEIVM